MVNFICYSIGLDFFNSLFIKSIDTFGRLLFKEINNAYHVQKFATADIQTGNRFRSNGNINYYDSLFGIWIDQVKI